VPGFEFIRNFVADGRMIRLGTPFNARAILPLREHLPVNYGLVIDEPAKSPNVKEVFWEKTAPIIPMLVKANAFLPRDSRLQAVSGFARGISRSYPRSSTVSLLSATIRC
jgi:hypothetical protein